MNFCLMYNIIGILLSPFFHVVTFLCSPSFQNNAFFPLVPTRFDVATKFSSTTLAPHEMHAHIYIKCIYSHAH